MNNCAFTALKEVLRAARSYRAALSIVYFDTRNDSALQRISYWGTILDKRIIEADYALLHGCSMPVQIEFPF